MKIHIYKPTLKVHTLLPQKSPLPPVPSHPASLYLRNAKSKGGEVFVNTPPPGVCCMFIQRLSVRFQR